MSASLLALASHPEGTVVPVRVTPRASRPGALGVREGALRVAVRAAPDKGKANRALIAWLAARLGVPRSRVTVLCGDTSRTKRLLVAGLDAEQVRLRLDASD